MSNNNKGFASMDKEKVKEIASKGGQHSHKNAGNNKDSNKSKPNDEAENKNKNEKGD